jgi:hypothetical protein
VRGAAARLESLGFNKIFRYRVAKAEWMAAGLPVEGEAASRPNAGILARSAVPRAGLREKAGEVAARVRSSGRNCAVVLNENSIVLGLLNQKTLEADAQASVEQVMERGPQTIRPHL